ncbi:MAG: helix-turn-helix domain-containing protein [Muribaculaceae bacterium]|nr:helix-turn-helix domain-containing protein [Muribaculaceae bacterium]
MILTTAQRYGINRQMTQVMVMACVTLVALVCALVGCDRVAVSSRQDQLDTLMYRCATTINRFDYTTLYDLSRLYLAEADHAGDKRHEAYAHFYLGAACLYSNRPDSAIAELQAAREMGQELSNDTIVTLALNSIGIHEATANNNLYLAQWYFTESLKHAKQCEYTKIEGSIYGNLCSIAQIQNDTTMIGYARECYEFGVRQKDPHLEFIGALHICDLSRLMGDMDTALFYCHKAIEVSDKNGLNDNAITYVSLSGIMYDRGRLAEADTYAQKAIELAEANSNKMVLVNAYDQKANICHKQGRYQESIEWLEKELAGGEQLEMVKEQIYDLMAQNYEAMGKTNKALECLTRAKEFSDSTNASDREHMKRERDMSFSIIEQQRELEFSQQQLRNRGIIIGGLVLLVLLLACLMWVTIRNMRRRNGLYHNIVRQHMESIEREKALNARIDELEATVPPEPDEPQSQAGKIVEVETVDESADVVLPKSLPTAKSEHIYRELCRLMEQERIYTDPQLNRESLAQRVGTNKSYLTTIISECSGGKNLSQFINHYRIQEAVRILSDREHINYPLKQLCTDLGFGSVSTFYKLFQEGVGMSPSAYRKSFIHMISTPPASE